MGVERGRTPDQESFDRTSMPPQEAGLAELSLEDQMIRMRRERRAQWALGEAAR